MGGLLRAPKPKVIAPPTPQTQAETVAANAVQTGAAADAAQSDARVEAIARARRGLPGTILTSARGVLDPAPAFATRKNLLGD